LSAVYEYWLLSVNGHTVCIHSASDASENPKDPNNYSAIFDVNASGGIVQWGGYGSPAVNGKVQVAVGTSSPSGCKGYALAYNVHVYPHN
jgi:hypothetical protein